jgi:ferredoxin, 2Fe-2S
MAKLTIRTREGIETTVEADQSLSVMEIIRDNGVDEVLAICGGCCSCATCHVYIDPAFADKLPKMSLDESDLLEGSRYRTEMSRLSCQIPMSGSLDGMRVTVAPED